MATAHDPDRPLTDTLRTIPFFRGLPADRAECVAVLRTGRVLRVASGETIQRIGDAPDLIFVIDGAVAVEGRVGPGGSPPGHFGALDLLATRRAGATLLAEGPTTVFRLPGSSFEPLLASCQQLARQLLSDFADHLASMARNEG